MAPKKAPTSGKPTPGSPEAQGFVRPQCVVSVAKNGEPLGRLVFELASDMVPRTVENFKQLAAGVTVGDKKNQKTACYKGCRFLRMTDEAIQSGDALQREDGKGNDSIYGTVFDDEQFGVYPHKFGVLSMCNSGPNTNGSQFFICRADCPHIDSRHVSFGKLVEGEEFLSQLADELSPFVDSSADGWGKVDATAPLCISAITMLS